MQVSSAVSRISRILVVLLLVAGSVALVGGSKSVYSPRDKAYYASKALVDFVNPGLNITINSAGISSAGVISVTYTLTDPTGLPLDASGTTTPGPISLAYVAAYIPKGQEQYVAYTTASATGPVLGTITRPDFETSGGTTVQVASGQYQYTFKAQAPAGFDPTVTTTVAVNGIRNLTAFDLSTNYAGSTFNFVPNGSPVTVTRDVIRTQSCNTCHFDLAFHGGNAHGMNMCVMCHQPQNADPTTGNTLDLKVFAHKLHMGSQLPSVLGYTSGTQTIPPAPYEIIGYMNSVNNFSTVIDPADPRRCEVCHSQTTGAAQAKAFLTEPTRAACGACHDDINFATGANHPGGFQTDDTQCATCHVPQDEEIFDASIMGAHVVPTDTAALYPENPDTQIAGLQLAITGVTNTSAGQAPTVAFTVQDNNKNNIPLAQLSTLQFTMAGPTTDYGYTVFGTATTPGYVTESALKAACSASGACTYTFTNVVPAAATGTYSIGGEARMTVTVYPNTNATQSVTEGADPNPVVNFSVDGSPVTPRRTVVALSNCNACHVALSLHGSLRNNTEYCVLCHNPSNTDISQRPSAVVAADKALPPQGINFNLLVHRIHDGVNAAINPGGPPKEPYIVVGFGGSHNDFSGTLFPVMSPAGDATYMQNCAVCHTNGSEQNLPIGLNAVQDPQGWIQGATGNPVQPASSACSGCHVSEGESAHFLANTDVLGESCNVCHAAGAQFAVDAVHVQ
ncbi:MAG TPA: OmcA/MtrC family decaheme c-type cytochrome [Bryobacteraceae bacterium]|nr:OmcA/MtrC family decaheme c-type cytochrome [Bryobacteraceae bacterium]